jgi:MoxR-like ATPase
MVASYIPRTLVANKGAPDERLITEDQIAILGAPTIILGDPGLGKTELTLSLEKLP